MEPFLLGAGEPRGDLQWVEPTLTLLGAGGGGFPGECRVGMTGAARGVWAGVLGSLLLISPAEAEAEAEPEAAPFPPEAAGRPGCCRHRQEMLMLMLPE